MSMNDPRPTDSRASPPRGPYVREQSNNGVLWIGALIAGAIVLGFVAWGTMSNNRHVTANPAVIVTPAPATGVPAPAPETTTGQAVPRGQ